MVKKYVNNCQLFVIKCILFASLFSLSCNANAEYYFVRSSVNTTCVSCSSCSHKHHVMKHHRVKKHYASHHHYAKPKHQVACYACGSCHVGSCQHTRHSHAKNNHQSYQEYEKRDSYNPDLSTGDDDASVYPGMQIN